MNGNLKVVSGVAGFVLATIAAADATFYEYENFAGPSFIATRAIANVDRVGFKGRAASVVVVGGRWEICEKLHFTGRCVVFRPGRYPSFGALGVSEYISAVREISPALRINDNRYVPLPAMVNDGVSPVNASPIESNLPTSTPSPAK